MANESVRVRKGDGAAAGWLVEAFVCGSWRFVSALDREADAEGVRGLLLGMLTDARARALREARTVAIGASAALVRIGGRTSIELGSGRRVELDGEVVDREAVVEVAMVLKRAIDGLVREASPWTVDLLLVEESGVVSERASFERQGGTVEEWVDVEREWFKVRHLGGVPIGPDSLCWCGRVEATLRTIAGKQGVYGFVLLEGVNHSQAGCVPIGGSP